ncbi:MAG: OprO/OprP family phosphate-selective porin [Gammaproteobacteria bacterium]|nr:OprO/OprP family phosphate-selective porin [Gammaproteobacteria bacterium]
MLNKKMKKLLIVTGIANCLLASPADAANWLMLQGTEPEASAPRIKTWGFIQAQYQKDNSDPNPGGAYIPRKMIGYDLTSQEQFNVNRARIGARGTGFPLDSNVNYFLLAEFGNNGITNANDGGTHVTDASITFNNIEGARIRAGLFKTPGAEEGLQAIHVFDYINFTQVTNQALLERFPNHDNYIKTTSPNAQGNTNPQNPELTGNPPAGFERPVGAFRDVGIQVFDSFKINGWDHSYAIMYGNGNGLNFGDNDNNKDLYLYWSSEMLFGGQGPRSEGLKLFAWKQTGKRLYDTDYGLAAAVGDGLGSITNQAFDRDRMGIGFKYLKKPWRVSAEYIEAEGMIFNGQHKESFDISQPGAGTPGDGLLGEANGYYVEGGWYIPNTKWELDLRYDVYNRLKSSDPQGVEFKTTTLGVQYHFNKKTRLTINYEDKEQASNGNVANLEANFKGLSDRYAAQLTHIF